MTSVSTDRRQGVNAGAAVKVPVKSASIAALTLSGEQTVDGVALVDGDRVLVKDQSDTTENGIYTVDTGDWERAVDFDGPFDVKEGTFVYVTDGSTTQGFWYVTSADPLTPGTSTIAFGRASSVLATVSAFVQTLLDDATAAAFMTTLGISSYIQTLLDDASASAARTTLGVGDIVPVTSVAGTNTVTGTIPAANSAYATNGVYVLVPAATNSGATTVNFTPSGASALGAKNVFFNGAACVGGELKSGVPVALCYDGTQFNVLGAAGVVKGTTTNDNAATGQVGEYVESEVLSGAAVSLTNATAANVTSISLTAGDWDVFGMIANSPGAGTTTSILAGAINTTSATLPSPPNKGGYGGFSGLAADADLADFHYFGRRLSLSATTTVYLVVYSEFATSTQGAYGHIGARRAR